MAKTKKTKAKKKKTPSAKKKPAKKTTKKAAAKKPSSLKTKKSKKKTSPKTKRPGSGKLISFTELFELKKQKLANDQQISKGNTSSVAHPTHPAKEEGPKLKEQAVERNVRNGRTNGSGARHH